ncbi:MAG: pyridoxal phosphate-dependent aminotransferase [Candidatus Korobacteraceae bacterium]|jgi:aspartate/methionine/tyrosine aminotransferase
MMTNSSITGKRIEKVPFAGIRKVADRAAELAAKGVKVIHFEAGRPDFDTPIHIKEAAKEALDQGIVYYAPSAGIPALREALAARISEEKGVRFGPQEIIVTGGGQQAIYLSLICILDPGDEVLVPDPGYSTFPWTVHLAGGVPVVVDAVPAENFSFDLEAAAKAVTPKTRAMLVNSPHNPSGSVFTREQLEKIAAFAAKHNLIIVSDEAYDRLVYGGSVHYSLASFPGMRERTIVCGSFSKTYAMTGWRIGYVAAPEPMISAATRAQQNLVLSLNSFVQMGAIAALTQSQTPTVDMIQEFGRRRELVLDRLQQVPGLELENRPYGGFYIFPKITVPYVTSAQLAEYLLETAGVAVVDGSVFGRNGNGHIRLSYACSYENCVEGMERLTAAMKKLVAEKKVCTSTLTGRKCTRLGGRG